jgi:molybdopterin converting factor small subunit
MSKHVNAIKIRFADFPGAVKEITMSEGQTIRDVLGTIGFDLNEEFSSLPIRLGENKGTFLLKNSLKATVNDVLKDGDTVHVLHGAFVD